MPDPTRSILRVATAGTGYFSRFHYEAWRRVERARLVAIANRTLAPAREVAAAHGIKDVFDDIDTMLGAVRPDVLDIITPPETHLASITSAARHGVFAICQKPFCRSLREAEAAVRIAKDSGIGLVVHENFRFQPWYVEIKRRLDAGALGRVWQATFRLRPGDGQGPDAYLDRQPYFQKMPRFLIHETAIHLFDVFRFLFGDIDAVYARLSSLNPVIAGEDAGLVMLEFRNGVRALFDGNRLADHAAANRRLTMGEMIVEGESGTLRLDGDGNLYFRRHGANDEARIEYEWANVGFAGDCVWRFQNHIARHILDDGPLLNSGEAYLTNIKVEEAVYASDAGGVRVRL